MTPHIAFQAAHEAWDAASELRQRRDRFKRYTYGRQWDDIVRTPSGELMTEGQYAELSGKKPLTNNMIRQLVKSVVGRFRYSLTHSDELTAGRQSLSDRAKVIARCNLLDELDCRMLEEFLISGCAIQRIVSERGAPGGCGVTIENVSPSRFFVNRFTDPRGADIELIGMVHDMNLQEVLMRYGHADAARIKHLRDIYARITASEFPDSGSRVGVPYSSESFYRAPSGRCRVIEVWRLEPVDLIRCHDPATGAMYYADAADEPDIRSANASRADVDAVMMRPLPTLQWHAYYFAPNGALLDHTPSPYPHRSHPFAVKMYPLIDGEVHPFVEDIIDQQRYINRLISIIDHILSFSAKGVLLFPTEQKPDELTWEEIGRRWTSPNGIIPYHGGCGPKPEQAYSTGNASGAYELLNTEMKLFEQVSGVSSALQGRQPDRNISGEMYQAQIDNAAIALLDIFDTFNSFRLLRDDIIEAVGKLPDYQSPKI